MPPRSEVSPVSSFADLLWSWFPDGRAINQPDTKTVSPKQGYDRRLRSQAEVAVRGDKLCPIRVGLCFKLSIEIKTRV